MLPLPLPPLPELLPASLPTIDEDDCTMDAEDGAAEGAFVGTGEGRFVGTAEGTAEGIFVGAGGAALEDGEDGVDSLDVSQSYARLVTKIQRDYPIGHHPMEPELSAGISQIERATS